MRCVVVSCPSCQSEMKIAELKQGDWKTINNVWGFYDYHCRVHGIAEYGMSAQEELRRRWDDTRSCDPIRDKKWYFCAPYHFKIIAKGVEIEDQEELQELMYMLRVDTYSTCMSKTESQKINETTRNAYFSVRG